MHVSADVILRSQTLKIRMLSRVYFQLSRFKICQCLWWPSSSLAEQKKPNQRRGGRKKKNRSTWRNAGRDIALRYSQAFDDKRAYTKTAAWRTCARSLYVAESDGNLLQSPPSCVVLWAHLQHNESTLRGDNEGGLEPNDICGGYQTGAGAPLQLSSSDTDVSTQPLQWQLVLCRLKIFTVLIIAG